ncbi:MAG: 5'-nucleotidase C-terminal domain-containing protein [Acidimicrobiales bacterium]
MRPPGGPRLLPATSALARSLAAALWVALVTAVVTALVIMMALLLAGPAGAVTGERSSGDEASIGGTVGDVSGEPVVGLKALLHTAGIDGETERFIRPAFTDKAGRFRFDDLPADCYLVTFEAPPGTSFEAASPTTQRRSCVDPGQADLAVDVALTAGQPVEPFTVNVLHIGDHHSHLLPTLVTVELAGEPTEIEIGGMARVATVISERSAALGAESTVAINTGGSLSGTIFYTVFGGAADAAALNTICFDLLGIGPDDLLHGRSQLEVFLDFLSDGPCGSAIVGGWDSNDPPLSAAQFAGGVVGFVPVPAVVDLAGPEEPAADSTLVSQTQAMIDELMLLGVDNVVLVSNVGLVADVRLAAQLSGVDAIVGGGSHSLLGDFVDLGLEVAGRYPLEVENFDGDPVCIGHAWQYATVVGEMQLNFDGQGRLADCGGQAHLLLSTIAEDPITKATVEGYVDALGQLANEPLGTVNDELCFTPIPSRSVGILCSDDVIGDSHRRPADVQLMIATALRRGAKIGIVNSGVTDSGLVVGSLDIGDAYQALGRDHSVYVLRMTGAEIETTLEEAIAAAVGDKQSSSAYPYASGLRWSYDPQGPAGARVSGLLVESTDGDWDELDQEAFYTVATTGFLAAGGDGYRVMASASSEGRARRTGVEYSQALFDYIEGDLAGQISPSAPDVPNR